MNWDIYSPARALWSLRLAGHNELTQLSVCAYSFAFFFFFSKHTFPYVNKIHTPVLLKSHRGFYGDFQGPQQPGVTLASQLSFSTHRYIHPAFWLDGLPPHHPSSPHIEFRFIPDAGGWSSHPPSLTMCSQHMLSVTLLYKEDDVPICQMRTLRLRNVW